MDQKKILLANTYDNETGAARASIRLFEALQRLHKDIKMQVMVKNGSNAGVIKPVGIIDKAIAKILPSIDKIPFRSSENKNLLSSAVFPFDISGLKLQKFDLLHLHWIAHGFIPIKSLSKIKTPIVWTLHDMWPFTGGCHYDMECGRYRTKCQQCPLMKNQCSFDMSTYVFNLKRTAWRACKFTFVTPSRWLAKCAKESELLNKHEVVVIPNGIDTDIFKPIPKDAARYILNLPKEKTLLLFGAIRASKDMRKGIDLLKDSLGKLAEMRSCNDLVLVIVGDDKPDTDEMLLNEFNSIHIGRVLDERVMSCLYSAADLFVAPSRQDNLPNTVMESLACGTPVIAFDVGGMQDMIIHEKNGFLATPFDTANLAACIRNAIENSQWRSNASQFARDIVCSSFTIESVAQRYQNLYDRILSIN